jgi:hypothetical protein
MQAYLVDLTTVADHKLRRIVRMTLIRLFDNHSQSAEIIFATDKPSSKPVTVKFQRISRSVKVIITPSANQSRSL